jgi:hypothetical protein
MPPRPPCRPRAGSHRMIRRRCRSRCCPIRTRAPRRFRCPAAATCAKCRWKSCSAGPMRGSTATTRSACSRRRRSANGSTASIACWRRWPTRLTPQPAVWRCSASPPAPRSTAGSRGSGRCPTAAGSIAASMPAGSVIPSDPRCAVTTADSITRDSPRAAIASPTHCRRAASPRGRGSAYAWNATSRCYRPCSRC